MDFIYTKNHKVDVYIPNQKHFITVVNFHGGGLVEGSRSDNNLVAICNNLRNKGFCVFNFDYSLYPNAKFPDFILDAALAVRCAITKSKELGGNGKIFVCGESAGAYLTAMLFANHKYLINVGVEPKQISGWMCESGQMSDHFHVLEYDFKLSPSLERITECAPLYFINKDFESNPIHLISYENDIEGRVKQNLAMKDCLEKLTNTKVTFSLLKGTHCAGSSYVDSDGECLFVKELENFISKNC